MEESENETYRRELMNKDGRIEILEKNVVSNWKINDKSNQDQLRAIIGICFMIGALTLMGLYSNLF